MIATLTFAGVSTFTGRIERHTYQTGCGVPALVLMGVGEEEGESIATLTLNPPNTAAGMQGDALAPNECVIKDYSENEGVFAQLVALGVVRDTGRRIRTGWVQSPVALIVHPDLGGKQPQSEREAGKGAATPEAHGHGATHALAGIKRGIAPQSVPMVGIGLQVGMATNWAASPLLRSEAEVQRENACNPLVAALIDASESLDLGPDDRGDA